MLSYTEFKNKLANGEESLVYLFEGEDAYFRERGLFLLKNEFVSEPEINCVVLPSDVNVESLLTSLNGYPFMSAKRMTVLREFYPKQDMLKKGLKDYIETPNPQGLLVILNEKPCESIKKLSNVCVVDCKKADIGLLVKWIKAECLRANVMVDAETARTLADFCLSDMTRIDVETKKLIAFVGDGGTLTIKDVESMVAKDTDHKTYEMTNYIAQKKFDLALDVIYDMLSKGETGQRILSSVYNYFRRLLHASISGKTASQLASMLGISEYPAKKLIEQAKLFKVKSLKKAVDRLIDSDFKIKSGKADVDNEMWLTVFAIMTEK